MGNKTLLMTHDDSIVHFGAVVDTDDISPCAHEEDDALNFALFSCCKVWS